MQTFEDEKNWHKDLINWKFFNLIYFNPKDNRIFVPKRIEWMGITLNFANPKSYIALLLMILFFGFIVFMISNNKSI